MISASLRLEPDQHSSDAQSSNLPTRRDAIQQSLAAVEEPVARLLLEFGSRLGGERDDLEALAQLVERRLSRTKLTKVKDTRRG